MGLVAAKKQWIRPRLRVHAERLKWIERRVLQLCRKVVKGEESLEVTKLKSIVHTQRQISKKLERRIF